MERRDVLSRLLARWSEVRDPVIASMIEELAPVAAGEVDEGAAASEDPLVLGALLSSVISGNAREALARATALASWPPDPRIARAVVSWLEALPYHATGSQPFWRAAFGLLERSADPRAIEALAKLPAHIKKTINGGSMRAWMEKEVGRARERLEGRFPDGLPSLSKAERAELAKAVRAAASTAPVRSSKSDAGARATPRPSAKAATGAELLAAIHERPEDDAARAVYADFLTERGDPRGELITLQLARARGTLDKKGAAREMALLKKNARAWTADLAPCVVVKPQYGLAVGAEPSGGQTRFDRGFLAECTIGGTPAKLKTMIGKPALATVEQLTCYEEREPEILAAIVSASVMRALRGVSVEAAAVPALAATPFAARLEALHVGSRDSGAFVEVVAACARMARLRSLALGLYQFEAQEADRAAWRRAATTLPLVELELTLYQFECRLRRERPSDPWAALINPDSDVGTAALVALADAPIATFSIASSFDPDAVGSAKKTIEKLLPRARFVPPA